MHSYDNNLAWHYRELIEVAIQELIAQNDIFNKKTAQGHDSFYKLNEKEVPLPNASPSIEISDTQSPITSDNLLKKNLRILIKLQIQ